MFNIAGLVSGYGQSKVIHGVDLAVAPGEIVAVMGRNGMGKTTLFKTMMGMLPAMHGSISLDGKALKPAQVKIAEKFENLFTALSVGKAPSTYVMIAFKLLDEKKTVTSADIVAAYKASGLGEGTARSQSGQIMHLFATVEIATRVGQTLTLNASSTIADRIRKVISSAS